jgi:predicted nucleic-acid-binding Zn-ribbon protein
MENKCPKCGGQMIEGNLRVDQDTAMPNQMNAYIGGLSTGGLPSMYDHSVSKPYWEEKTGKKTGFLIKNEEKRTLKIKGMRCSLCGFIEFYTSGAQE